MCVVFVLTIIICHVCLNKCWTLVGWMPQSGSMILEKCVQHISNFSRMFDMWCPSDWESFASIGGQKHCLPTSIG